MADVVHFHHALGLTDGVHALGERLRAGGPTVHLPDLYDGRTFGSGEPFTYPGGQHLFVDSTLPSYDEDAARLVADRVPDFLARVG